MDSVIIFCATYLFIFVVLGLGIIWLKVDKTLKKQLIVATVLAGGIALLLSRVAGHLYYHPRPFASQHIRPLIAHAADNGFPSDHALFTATLTALAFFYRKKYAAGMLILTVIVGIARVLAKVHSPIDIIGGWVLGSVGAVAGFYLARQIFRNRP